MYLDGRDRLVLQLIARYKQVSSRQVHTLLYDDCASYTPCQRTLLRLTERKWLSRIERRIVGGSRGGSGQYVYQLGREGLRLSDEGRRYIPSRNVNYHALAIVDCVITLKQLERTGSILIHGISPEPDCWAAIGSIELKPDLLVDVSTPSRKRLKLWLEVDMGSEGQRQLKGKLEAYWRAYNEADVSQWPVFPKVLWVAVDDDRAKELRWLVEQGAHDAQALFAVTTKEHLANVLL